ncbi:hypothetical protein SacmaDRAFT_3950 [Saccharomonospora marina XMU15]|uniref:Uncharacterized protein n=1 Tax=Saccharomonospora marina XMU15 TaxID=882083 RepID=H5X3T0_9PSEU|nr:hypothetical protein [Saccharomonospora marina]EHR52148.1 hypothetical protein SacmaDRAFT_3950 [Saccharomonospora marina XMU15]
MLTLSFLWNWTKITALAVIAVVIEQALITDPWVFIGAVAVTGGVWLLITVGLYREWRTHGTGYRHQVAEWVTDRTDRRTR